MFSTHILYDNSYFFLHYNSFFRSVPLTYPDYKLEGHKAHYDSGSLKVTNTLKDFILKISTKSPHTPSLLAERGDQGEVTFCLALNPESIDQTTEDIEIIFLLDRSGSMTGTKIGAVRNAMKIFLRSLPQQCTFNSTMSISDNLLVIGFGSSFIPLFNRSKALSAASFTEANAHINELKADLGGTVILSPLKHIFNTIQEEATNTTKYLMIFTDGQVDSAPEVLSLVKQRSSLIRIFSFGVGGDVDKDFIKGMARSASGRSEFIGNADDLESKVGHYLKKMVLQGSALMKEIRVEWPDTLAHKILQSPIQIPPIFRRECKLIFMQIPPQEELRDVRLRIHYKDKNGKEKSEELMVPEIKKGEEYNFVVHRLTARALLRDIEENASCYHVNGKLKDGLSDDFIRNETITLSTRWGVVCSLTSLVCVSRNRNVVTQDAMELVPVENDNDDDDDDAMDVGVRGRTRDRKTKVDYKPRYRSRSCSRSASPDGSVWKPRSRSKSPVNWGSKKKASGSGSDSDDASPLPRRGRRGSPSYTPPDSDSESGSGSRSRSSSPIPKRRLSTSPPRSRSPSPVPPATSSNPKKKGVAAALLSWIKSDKSEKKDKKKTPAPVVQQKEEKKQLKVNKKKPMGKPKLDANMDDAKLNVPTHNDIINLMSFDGSWDLSALANVVPKGDIDSIKNKLALPDNLIATLIAIVILESRYADRKRAWKLVVEKARQFLTDNWNISFGVTVDAALLIVKSLI